MWHSPRGCEEVVSAGGRLERGGPEVLRLATWNLRWFPFGCPPGRTCPERATDIDWLACTLTWMDVDLVALQEISVAAPDARGGDSPLGRLTDALDRATGGSWSVDLQDCGGRGAQRVGFLWNRDRLELTGFADTWELNGDLLASPSNPCAARLRPGCYARATGLRTDGSRGVDFHLLSVHLDSGRGDLDYTRRRRALARLAVVEHGERPIRDVDDDVVILGDFNTMGRNDPPHRSGDQEIALFESELADQGYRRLSSAADPYCTDYFQRRAGALDHAVASVDMEEVAPEARARVTGVCALRGCQNLTDPEPVAVQRLSDHCPVVIELVNEDRDE